MILNGATEGEIMGNLRLRLEGFHPQIDEDVVGMFSLTHDGILGQKKKWSFV